MVYFFSEIKISNYYDSFMRFHQSIVNCQLSIVIIKYHVYIIIYSLLSIHFYLLSIPSLPNEYLRRYQDEYFSLPGMFLQFFSKVFLSDLRCLSIYRGYEKIN